MGVTMKSESPLKAAVSVSAMCRLLKMSRSQFYWHVKRATLMASTANNKSTRAQERSTSRCWTLMRASVPRRFPSSSARATLRWRPPVQPSAMVR